MEYGININFFARYLGIKAAAEMVAKSGFTMLDYNPYVNKDSWESDMKEAVKIFDFYGLTVHQTHAPFNRYGSYGDKHQLCLQRCAEATEFMGAKFMVAHGDEFDFERLTFSPDAALEYNHNLFGPFVERAKQAGYKVAFETVFEDMNCRRYTSKADELIELIGSFNSENAVCCWDFGHSNVAFGKDAPKVIGKLGKLIQCTHLHDNTGTDSHQMPMTGDIDWKATIGAFKDIDYKGVMSVEYAHGSMSECLVQEFLNLTLKAARQVWSL